MTEKRAGRHTRHESPRDPADLLDRWQAQRREEQEHFTAASAMAEHARQRDERSAPPANVRVDFKPPAGHRRWMGVLLALCLVLAVPAVLRAIELRTSYDLGLSVFFCGMAMIFWWGMVGATTYRIRIVGGVLEVEQGRDLKRFDLRDTAQRVHMHGTPDSKDWRVSLEQPPRPPFVIDRRMVDPVEFSRVVERYRGQLYRR